jgi:hypothetical protein
MSKATRIRQQNAREKIAAQRAAARGAEVRRQVLIAGGSVVVVLAIVLTFVFIKLGNRSSNGGSAASSVTGTALPASVVNNVTGVPASTLNTVGVGSLSGGGPPIRSISDTPLTSGGKPEMLYIGAEFCPYCAAMRWSMAVALSRFGTLSPLHGIYSSSSAGEVDPHTATLTFYKSSYSSKYLVFSTVEEQTVSKATLQVPTSQQQALVTKYDNPPYVPSSSADAIPFIDFGGKYLVHGAQFNPQLLQGQTWSQVAAALQDKSSSIGQGTDGAANMITAAICKMTSNQPSSVCTSSTIKSMQGQL